MDKPTLPVVRDRRAEVAVRAMTRGGEARTGYRVRVSSTEADVRAAQSLRFQVFNIELNEGLESSYATLRDEDPFDPVCDHLLVEDESTGDVVGTYRLQTGTMAMANLGFYSAQEFEFGTFQDVHGEMVELGRACVHRSHRNLHVLTLLWRGIRDYARERGCRYLIGCSSLTSQDPRDGAAVYLELGPDYLVDARFRTHPTPQFVCPLDEVAGGVTRIPPLLRAYLSLGARICGAPALDGAFKTIDFLTWLDLETLPSAARRILG